MANMRRARKAVARQRIRRPAADEAFQQTVSTAVSDMEEPLREARHLIHVIGAISQYRGEDNEAVSTVAEQANLRLGVVEHRLRRLFKAFRGLKS